MAKVSWYAGAIALALLSGCAVDWENRHASQEVAKLAAPQGSVYLGWRVFQDKCAACHGATATGTANAPDLLPRVRSLGERQFVSLVLQRYDLTRPTLQPGSGSAAAQPQIEIAMQRKDAPLVMPAWQAEPRVNAHILDLHAYLSARADGRQGTERPAP